MSINEDIINQFQVTGSVLKIEPYGEGHINDTYRVTMDDNGTINSYVIQAINKNVFSDVDGLMHNIVGVTNFIKNKIEQEGGDVSRSLEVILTKCGKHYCTDDKNRVFRCYNHIENTVCIESKPTPHQFYLSGVGFGKFQKYLSDFPAELLTEPIKNFHNTEDRLNNFLKSIKDNKVQRLESVLDEVDFFIERANYASKVLTLMKSGDIPCRVTHNDTKLNNILIDTVEDKAVTVIDLDTVMPGSIIYDFGDSIRSGANVASEDEKNLEKVEFSLELFDAFCKGFLKEVKEILTPAEVDNMAFGAILMTYECGMRFLTDYLDGDVYFKTNTKTHNLDRARTQMKLILDMESVFDKMNDIVKKYAK